jgi:NTE family protein
MKRALVLGGGGPVGVAWETGVLAGLLEEGVDVRNADLVVGTSAGSIVGTQVTRGRDLRAALADVGQSGDRVAANAAQRDVEAVTRAFSLWASFDEMTPDRCAQVGAVALAATTMSEQGWIAGILTDGRGAWPARLVVTAVDCNSGELRAFDAAQGIDLQRAVAASCAVPAIFPPVTIEGRRYMDGGVRSGTSADLALRLPPDVALIIAPMGSSDAGMGALFRRQIAGERATLEAAGARVSVVQMDDASRAAAPNGLMDPSARAPVAAAGRAQAARIAKEVAALWNE